MDDAQALKRKEWKRGEPGEDIPWQCSAVCGHLTPTQPRHEGSLRNLPAAVGGAEDSRREQRAQEASKIEMNGTCPSTTIVASTEETPYTSVKQYLEGIPVNKGQVR